MFKRLQKIKYEESGYAVVEATIIFPIICMIFAGLVLLSMYLPARATLQRATQYAANAAAVSRGAEWLYFDADDMEYAYKSKESLRNVYAEVIGQFRGRNDSESSDIEKMVKTIANEGVMKLCDESGSGDESFSVDYEINNYVVYKEITVTASKAYRSPVNLSFIGFPQEIKLEVTSTAVVHNGDEFIRNMDIVGDFFKYIDKKYHISDNAFVEKLSNGMNRVREWMGLR